MTLQEPYQKRNKRGERKRKVIVAFFTTCIEHGGQPRMEGRRKTRVNVSTNLGLTQ